MIEETPTRNMLLATGDFNANMHRALSEEERKIGGEGQGGGLVLLYYCTTIHIF